MHIELLKAHTHAGKAHRPGARLDLNESSAQWLIDLKVAKVVSPESNKTSSRKGD
ncbi:MAG: hypothetical protein KTR20_04390 [Cellvibrionaceae bacterium]|nr:hypothetical protein [Cellvibrionaceae bacterium]